MPFVKLDCGILDSSLWSEDSDTRIVWITLLAMCDAAGEVRATVSAIARRAAVPRDKADKAVESFLGPDADDRSGVNEGRRLERIQGGFKIVNYVKYRERDDTAALRAQRYRQRHAVTPVTNRDVTRNVTQAEAEAEASASAEAECSSPLPPAQKAGGGGPHRGEAPGEPPAWTRGTEALVHRLQGLGCPEGSETCIKHLKTAMCSGLTVDDFNRFLDTGGHAGKHIWSIVQAVNMAVADRKRSDQNAEEVAKRRDQARIIEEERTAINAYLAQCCTEELDELRATAESKADEKKLTGTMRAIFLDAAMRAEALRRSQAITPPKL